MVLSLKWGNRAGVNKFAKAVDVLGSSRFLKAGNRAVNRVGGKAKTHTGRALRPQTGLKRPTIIRALKVKRSNWQTLTYEISSSGGDIALKHFCARETRKGVSAAPFGKRRVFAGTFLKGGLFPNRKALAMGGQVWKRVGGGRRPIEKQLSGVIIPNEMVKGRTKAAFEREAAHLDDVMAKEIRKITSGIIS